MNTRQASLIEYHKQKERREAIEGAFVSVCFAILTFLPAVLIFTAKF